MLEKVDALPQQLGRPETLLADNGYFSEANVMTCTAANIEPLPTCRAPSKDGCGGTAATSM